MQMCYAIATKVANVGLIRNITAVMPINVFSTYKGSTLNTYPLHLLRRKSQFHQGLKIKHSGHSQHKEQLLSKSLEAECSPSFIIKALKHLKCVGP